MTWQIDEGAREPVIIPVLKLIDNEQGRRNKGAWGVIAPRILAELGYKPALSKYYYSFPPPDFKTFPSALMSGQLTFVCVIPFLLQQLYTVMSEPRGVVPGGAGGAMAPRSVNPISSRGGRLCLPNYTGTPGFSDLPTALKP